MITTPGFSLLVGTGEGLYEFGARERSDFRGHEITALAGDGCCWWALVDGRTVWRSPGDGSWKELAALQDDSGTCLAVTPAGLLVGTAGAHLLHLTGGRFIQVEAFEQVEGREEWYTPWGDPPWFGSNIDTFCLAASGTTAAFGTEEGLLFLSPDAGTSWETVAKDLRAVQCVSIADDRQLGRNSRQGGAR